MSATVIELLTSAEARAVGIGLLHFVWQASLVALVLAALLGSLDKRAARLRYAISCAALALLVVLPVRTTLLAFEPAPAVTATALESEEPRTLQHALVSGVTHAVLEINRAATWRERLDGAGRALVDMTPWLVAFWITGVAVFSLRFAAGIAQAHRLTHHGVAPVPAACREMLERLAARLGLEGRVSVLLTTRINVPAVVGFIKPVVLVPAAALTGLNPQQLETILAHELAHVRRHDFLVNLAQSVVETLFFYHPGVWWISRQVRIEREHCCDDLAVSVCGDAVEYARALAVLEEMRASGTGLALAATGGSLLNRVRRLAGMGPRQRSAGQLAGAAMGVMAGLMALALPLGFLSQQAFALSSGSGETAVTVVGERLEPVDCRNTADCEVLTSEQREELEQSLAAAGPALHQAHIAHADGMAALQAVHGSELAMGLAGINGIVNAAVTSSLESLAQAPAPPAAPAPPRVSVTAPPAPPAAAPRTKRRSSDRPMSWDNLDVDDLVAMKVSGLTREYVEQMAAEGFRNLSFDELVGMRHLNVTPVYARDMQALFGGSIDIEEIVGFKALGVTVSYVEELRTAGLLRLDPEDVASFKAMGISAATIRDLRAAVPSLRHAEDFLAYKAMNITGAWLNEIASAGYPVDDHEHLVAMRAVGVTAEWIQGLRAAGLEEISADDLVALRAVGVTGDYVRELRAAGLKDFGPKRLIELKAHGIDGEWLRTVK